ncbi:MAG: DUF4124 domain-containing protein [Halieaceae bacterium]
MKLKLVVLLLLCASAASVNAQKLYKIVDDEGNVSFSQFPPAEKKENVTVDDITVSGGPQTSVSEGMDGKYCGNIRLPKQGSSRSSATSYVKNLNRKRSSWRDQLDRLNKSIDNNNQNAIKSNQYKSKYGQASTNKRYQDSIAANGERLRDLRCALDWVDEELDGTRDVVADNNQERARLEKIRDDLQARLDKRCGQLPAYDPSDGRNDALRRSWYDCSDKTRRELNRVDRALSKL